MIDFDMIVKHFLCFLYQTFSLKNSNLLIKMTESVKTNQVSISSKKDPLEVCNKLGVEACP